MSFYKYKNHNNSRAWRVVSLLAAFTAVFSLGFGAHMSWTSSTATAHATASASQHAPGAGHAAFSCSTACTLARPTRLEKLKKAVKRTGRKLLPQVPTEYILAFMSLTVHTRNEAPKRCILRPPPYRLYTCYIS